MRLRCGKRTLSATKLHYRLTQRKELIDISGEGIAFSFGTLHIIKDKKRNV